MREPQVSLVWCVSWVVVYGGTPRVTKRFVVRGHDIEKAWLHLRDAGPSDRDDWQDVKLAETSKLPDGSRLFTLDAEHGRLPASMEFAVGAKGSGTSVWDNHGGHNYVLRSGDGPLLCVPIVLGTHGFYQGQLFGTVYVRAHPENRVHVYWSVDGCRSFRAFDASKLAQLRMGPSSLLPMPNRHGCEAWEFSIPVSAPSPAGAAVLFVERSAAGDTAHDLNFNRLYHVPLPAAD